MKGAYKMAENKKTAYRVNAEKKVITIDRTVKATEQDEKDISRYLSAGYVIRHKSEARAAKAKQRAITLPNKAEIEKISAIIKEEIKNDTNKLNAYSKVEVEYNKLIPKNGLGTGFFAARKVYITKVNDLFDNASYIENKITQIRVKDKEAK